MVVTKKLLQCEILCSNVVKVVDLFCESMELKPTLIIGGLLMFKARVISFARYQLSRRLGDISTLIFTRNWFIIGIRPMVLMLFAAIFVAIPSFAIANEPKVYEISNKIIVAPTTSTHCNSLRNFSEGVADSAVAGNIPIEYRYANYHDNGRKFQVEVETCHRDTTNVYSPI